MCVIKADDKLSCVRSIVHVQMHYCYGIDCHQGRLYVVCIEPSSVIVLTTQGKVLNYTPLKFLSVDYFPYIAMRKDYNLMYTSDCSNNSLVLLSLLGNKLATYKQEDLQGPLAMCLLDDGSLLVCCLKNGTIHQVNGDLKEGKIMYKDIACLKSISYSAHNDEVYVSNYEEDHLKVLGTKYIA